MGVETVDDLRSDILSITYRVEFVLFTGSWSQEGHSVSRLRTPLSFYIPQKSRAKVCEMTGLKASSQRRVQIMLLVVE